MSANFQVRDIDFKPPIYFNVQKAVRRFKRVSLVQVEYKQHPVLAILKAMFPGIRLEIIDLLVDLRIGAVYAEVDNPGDNVFRFRHPGSPLGANLLITFVEVPP